MAANEEVKAFLGAVMEARFRYRRACRKVEELEERCEQITTTWSEAPGGGGDVHKDGPIIALAQKRSELPTLYAAWERAEEEVDRFLDEITDNRYRAILKLRYVDLLRWPKVLEKLKSEAGIYYEERQMFTLHGKALNAAQELLDEKKKAREAEAEKRLEEILNG